MVAKYSRHIALTAPLAAYIDRQVLTGEYASPSDVVRTALRLLMARDQHGTERAGVDEADRNGLP